MDKTSTLTGEVKILYEKVFLKRAEYELVLKEGAQMGTQGQNDGKTIWFNRYTPQDIETTPLTEGENPDVCSITAENVSVVLAEYGRTFKISKFLTLTSVDKNNKNKISLLGQHMGETLNRLVRNELENGTARIANGVAASAVAASDTLDADEVRDIVEGLEDNKTIAYPDGYYMGKVVTKSKTSLVKDNTWINAKTYSDVKDLYRGEMGELYQVRFLLNKDGKTSTGTGAASTVTLYHNYFHGAEAIGCYDLSGDVPQLYIVPNKPDSGNPAGRFSLTSWAGSYASKILNPEWVTVSKAAG